MDDPAGATAAQLAGHGWAQGHGEADGALCVTWAAYRAHGCQKPPDTVYGDGRYMQAATFIGRLNAAARDLFPQRLPAYHCAGTEAIHVNDHPDTTLEDVLLIVKHAGQ